MAFPLRKQARLFVTNSLPPLLEPEGNDREHGGALLSLPSSLFSCYANGAPFCSTCPASLMGMRRGARITMASRRNCDRWRWTFPLLVIRCQGYSRKVCHRSDRIAAAYGIRGGRRRLHGLS